MRGVAEGPSGGEARGSNLPIQGIETWAALQLRRGGRIDMRRTANPVYEGANPSLASKGLICQHF